MALKSYCLLECYAVHCIRSLITIQRNIPSSVFRVEELAKQVNSALPIQTNKTNSVALVRKRTISTEQPWLVGEVNDNFYG
jgi:hypothetical protein